MKKKLIYFGALALVLLIACDKYNDLGSNDPLSNPSYLYGRLFMTDTLTQSLISTPLASKTITVLYSDDPDPLNYRYSTTTDANGYFKFPALNGKKTYRLIYKETVGGKVFMADTNGLALPQEKAEVTAKLALTGQTGILYRVQDNTGKALGSVPVCTSISILPYTNENCDGSLFSASTDAYGHVSAFNLAAGDYYAVAKATINGKAYIGKQTFNISNKVEKRTITMQLQGTPAPNNGLNVTLLDQNGKPVNGGRICLYTSRVLFARDTCEGSSYSFATGPAGTAGVTNVVPGFYYILGDASVTGFKYLARDSIAINTSVVSRTLTLKH